MNKKTNIPLRKVDKFAQERVNQSKKKWSNIKIDRELRDIIHGYIASDAYLRWDGILTVDQGIDQENFVKWLYEKFKNIRTSSPISEATRTRTKKGITKTTKSKRFNTRALLKGFHKMWYQSYIDNEGKTRYKKRLPKGIKSFFSSTFLTVWFAGDGTKIIGSRGAKYEATSFTVDERLQLQKLFKEKFDIEVEINRAGESETGTPQWTLSINSPEYDKFRNEITKMDLIPTIFPDKLHKAQP